MRDRIARAIDPTSWRLHDDPQYAHLPDEAREAVTAQSFAATDRVLAALCDPVIETEQLQVVTMMLDPDDMVPRPIVESHARIVVHALRLVLAGVPSIEATLQAREMEAAR